MKRAADYTNDDLEALWLIDSEVKHRRHASSRPTTNSSFKLAKSEKWLIALGYIGVCIAGAFLRDREFRPSLPISIALLVLWLLSVAAFAYGLRRVGRIRARAQYARNGSIERSLSIEDHIVLYLRPFETAGELRMPIRLPSFAERSLLGSAWDVEFALAYALEGVCTMVAVGDSSKGYGAAKVTIPDSDWQARVLELAEIARAIFVVPLPRPGTLWEVRQLFQSGELLCKSIFLMPPETRRGAALAFLRGRRSMPARWQEARETLKGEGISLPEYRRSGAFLMFDGRDTAPLQLDLCRLSPRYVERITAGSSLVSRGDLEMSALSTVPLDPEPGASRLSRVGLWPRTASSVVRASILVIVFSSMYEPFRIPSSSMFPSLLIGDHMFVDRLAYSPNSAIGQVVSLIVGNDDPARGDVVVFDVARNGSGIVASDRRPDLPTDTFVKRIIGLPGDVVEVRSGQLHLNGEPVPTRSTGEKFVDEYGRTLDVSIETLDGFEHGVLDLPGARDIDFRRTTIEPGRYLTMGDNRDNSRDGREWGTIRRDEMRGRVVFIYWSWDSERFSRLQMFSPLTWWDLLVHRTRWARIGDSVK